MLWKIIFLNYCNDNLLIRYFEELLGDKNTCEFNSIYFRELTFLKVSRGLILEIGISKSFLVQWNLSISPNLLELFTILNKDISLGHILFYLENSYLDFHIEQFFDPFFWSIFSRVIIFHDFVSIFVYKI